MKLRFVPLVFFLLPLGSLFGQEVDLDMRYLKLQEAYTQRLQEIETRHEKTERELLNQFILSLPRVELEFRESGDLNGVVACRELQEFMLTEMKFPPRNPDAPELIRDKIEQLHEQRKESFESNQNDLNQLNKLLLDALEPYQVAFTKANQLPKALEIRELRLRLQQALGGETPGPTTTGPTPEPVRISNNPNALPFSFEPRRWKGLPGVTGRETAIGYEIKVDGDAEVAPRGLVMRNGLLTIPQQATTILLDRAKRNPMLSVEFSARSTASHQWNAQAPAVVFLYGNTLRDANLAVTQEGRNYYLYLRTTSAPVKRPLHRINLGRVADGRPQHFTITFRSGELTVYVDGSETDKLRNITGLFNNWDPYPVKMGRHPAPTGVPDLPKNIHWRGTLFQFNITTSLESARGASTNYNRFSRALTQ